MCHAQRMAPELHMGHTVHIAQHLIAHVTLYTQNTAPGVWLCFQEHADVLSAVKGSGNSGLTMGASLTL